MLLPCRRSGGRCDTKQALVRVAPGLAPNKSCAGARGSTPGCGCDLNQELPLSEHLVRGGGAADYHHRGGGRRLGARSACCLRSCCRCRRSVKDADARAGQRAPSIAAVTTQPAAAAPTAAHDSAVALSAAVQRWCTTWRCSPPRTVQWLSTPSALSCRCSCVAAAAAEASLVFPAAAAAGQVSCAARCCTSVCEERSRPLRSGQKEGLLQGLRGDDDGGDSWHSSAEEDEGSGTGGGGGGQRYASFHAVEGGAAVGELELQLSGGRLLKGIPHALEWRWGWGCSAVQCSSGASHPPDTGAPGPPSRSPRPRAPPPHCCSSRRTARRRQPCRATRSPPWDIPVAPPAPGGLGVRSPSLP